MNNKNNVNFNNFIVLDKDGNIVEGEHKDVKHVKASMKDVLADRLKTEIVIKAEDMPNAIIKPQHGVFIASDAGCFAQGYSKAVEASIMAAMNKDPHMRDMVIHAVDAYLKIWLGGRK